MYDQRIWWRRRRRTGLQIGTLTALSLILNGLCAAALTYAGPLGGMWLLVACPVIVGLLMLGAAFIEHRFIPLAITGFLVTLAGLIGMLPCVRWIAWSILLPPMWIATVVGTFIGGVISSHLYEIRIGARGACPACGYDLRGLPRQVCPECGRPFELEEVGVEQGKLVNGNGT